MNIYFPEYIYNANKLITKGKSTQSEKNLCDYMN